MKWFATLLVISLAMTLGCAKDSGNDNQGPTGTDNHAPTIVSIEASPVEVVHQRNTTLVCVATDTDRDSLTYVWSCRFGTVSADKAVADWHSPLETGTYWVKVTVSDGVDIDVDSVQVIVAANRLPVIGFLSTDERDIIHGHSSSISCIATDEDGDILRYSWIPSGGVVQGSGSSILWFGPQASGNYWVVVSVGDGIEAVKDSIRMTILPNRAPEIHGMVANPLNVGYGDRPLIFCNATDPDGDELTYLWTFQAGAVYGEGANVSWQAPGLTGTYWVAADVNDGFTSVQDTVFINVIPSNNPPAMAHDPSPASGALHIDPSSVTLRWRCEDPDGDALTYDLYFGNSPPWGAVFQRDLNTASFVITGLNQDMQYYWGIVAKDGKGGESRITAWNFHTTQ